MFLAKGRNLRNEKRCSSAFLARGDLGRISNKMELQALKSSALLVPGETRLADGLS